MPVTITKGDVTKCLVLSDQDSKTQRWDICYGVETRKSSNFTHVRSWKHKKKTPNMYHGDKIVADSFPVNRLVD